MSAWSDTSTYKLTVHPLKHDNILDGVLLKLLDIESPWIFHSETVPYRTAAQSLSAHLQRSSVGDLSSWDPEKEHSLKHSYCAVHPHRYL